MSIYRKKIDINQPELVDYARSLGASVAHLHRVGGGVPDLLIGFDGKNYLIEVKNEKGKLNKLQIKFRDEWNGNFFVARNKEDIRSILDGKFK